MRYLMENAGAVLSRAQLLNANWRSNFDPGTKVVDVYVRYLRKKIDDGEAVPLPDGSRRGVPALGNRGVTVASAEAAMPWRGNGQRRIGARSPSRIPATLTIDQIEEAIDAQIRTRMQAEEATQGAGPIGRRR